MGIIILSLISIVMAAYYGSMTIPAEDAVRWGNFKGSPENDFSGSAFSPAAYQILEGLQPGVNFTWRLLFQKRITKYLDANLQAAKNGMELAAGKKDPNIWADNNCRIHNPKEGTPSW